MWFGTNEIHPHKALPLVYAADIAQTFVVWSLGPSPLLLVKASTEPKPELAIWHADLAAAMKPASTHILPVHSHEGIRPCDAKRKKMRSSGQLVRVCWPSSAEHTATSLSGIKATRSPSYYRPW